MKLKSLLGALVAFMALTQVACADGEQNAAVSVKEGTDYSVISGAKATSKPEVIEFFSYTCPHCYTMEGFIHKWLPKKPSQVTFKQVPVYMSQVPHLARAYYTGEVLNVLDKTHMAIFNRMHKEKRAVSSKADLIPIFEAAGVSKEEFEKAYNSFAVESKINYAKKLVRDKKVLSFPMFVVNGQYKIENYKNLEYLLSDFAIKQAK